MAVCFPWFGDVLLANPIASSDLQEGPAQGSRGLGSLGVVRVAVKAGVEWVQCCVGAGPGPSALGWAESTAAAVTWLCPPAQLYILKHHHGAHMPDLCGGRREESACREWGFQTAS